MKKFNKKLYTLMFASALIPSGPSYAETDSQWECKPSPDFRSWTCLKDGKAPVEEIPATVAEQPQAPEQPESVTITPLAPPETIQPAEIAEPATAPEAEDTPVVSTEPPDEIEPPPTLAQPEAEPTTEEPTAVEPVLADEPTPPAEAPVATTGPATEIEPLPPEVQPETEPAVTEKPVAEPVLADEAALPAETETEAIPEPVAEPAVVSESTDTPAETPATKVAPPAAEEQPYISTERLVDRYAPIESPLVSVDESLRSCVAITRATDLSGEEVQQLRDRSPTEIEADEAEIEKDKETILTGNVNIRRADQHLQSEKVVLNRQTNQADAEGKIDYVDSQIQIKAEQAHLDFDRDENSFAEASFVTLDRYSRGTAGQIQTQQGSRLEMDKVTYTTCPPGSNAWQLEAGEITMDDETGRGEARDVKLSFYDVPILYTPYFTYPIDDRRKSGLLTPRFGRSDTRGTELTTPIYWNIAPDKDATFYPRIMSERGLQLGGEYR